MFMINQKNYKYLFLEISSFDCASTSPPSTKVPMSFILSAMSWSVMSSRLPSFNPKNRFSSSWCFASFRYSVELSVNSMIRVCKKIFLTKGTYNSFELSYTSETLYQIDLFKIFTIYIYILSSSTSKNKTHQKTPLGVTTPLYESTTKKNLIKVRNLIQKWISIYL